MKSFFLAGPWHTNAGPYNVNRSLIENSDGTMVYIKTEKNRYIRKLEFLLKFIRNRLVVLSAYGLNDFEWLIAKLFNKRVFVLMHGCLKYENEINKLCLNPQKIRLEYKKLENSYKIIAVSKIHAEHLCKIYPEFSSKVTYVNNGIGITDTFISRGNKSNVYKLALSGGNRQIKRNLNVCIAVEKLISKGLKIEILLFGETYSAGENMSNFSFVREMGQLDKERYYEILKNVDLFVLNSEAETFGLVVADAINNGCSLLLSRNVGALAIFGSLENQDVINDVWDINEIAFKVENLLLNGNARRLYESIDREKCSVRSSFLRLKEICFED